MVGENEQASEREIACRVELSAALKRDARVEPLVGLDTGVTFQYRGDFRARLLVRFPRLFHKRKERLLVVYPEPKPKFTPI